MQPRIHWRGLRIRIIAWSFVPTMIIMIAVAVFIFNAYENVTEDLLIEENRDSARFEASQFSVELSEYVDLLESEARVLGALQEDQPFQQETLASSSNRFAVFDGGVVLLDNYGVVIATEPVRPEILGLDWSDHMYYNQITRSEVLVSGIFSDIVSDGPNGKEVIVVAVSVTDIQGHSVGVLAGMFHVGASAVSAFYGDIVKLDWGEGGSAYLVDSTGKIIYHTNTDQIGKNISTQDVVVQVINGSSDAIRTNDLEDNNVLASFAPVSGTAWGLVTEEDWETVIGSNQGYRNILMLLLALGVILPAVIVHFGVRRITRPIAEVSGAAKEIAAGNFSHRITTATGDELEEMANQFNTMAGALEESYSNLEQKVEERTKGERRRAEQLRAINDVGRGISSILDLDELLIYVVKSIQETFSYYNVAIILLDQNSGTLALKASAGAYGGGLDIDFDASETRGVVDAVIQDNEPMLIDDVPNHPAYNHLGIEALAETGSEMAVPIMLGDKTVGVLDIEADSVDAFDELDLFTAQTLADQLAIAIDNARLYEQAQELATVEERQRLARDLHDAVTQTLFSASLIAEVLPKLWEKNPEEGKKRLEELRRSTKGALAEMRILLLELRPAALTEVSLGELLRQMVDAAVGKVGIPVNLTVEGQGSLPADVQIAFYRVAQEALNNIQKHASASEISVTLRYQPESVTLTIVDNGTGFDPGSVSAEHLGLSIMCERAKAIGTECKIESEIGQGTRIMVEWQVSD
ncbi:MAG: GAF domain-containing protein [Planctomycetes bacterium]|nr:GAF domain-containing protein [Planctomycetota bacterium]